VLKGVRSVILRLDAAMRVQQWRPGRRKYPFRLFRRLLLKQALCNNDDNYNNYYYNYYNNNNNYNSDVYMRVQQWRPGRRKYPFRLLRRLLLKQALCNNDDNYNNYYYNYYNNYNSDVYMRV